jgi:hypothetical protein
MTMRKEHAPDFLHDRDAWPDYGVNFQHPDSGWPVEVSWNDDGDERIRIDHCPDIYASNGPEYGPDCEAATIARQWSKRHAGRWFPDAHAVVEWLLGEGVSRYDLI